MMSTYSSDSAPSGRKIGYKNHAKYDSEYMMMKFGKVEPASPT